MTPCIYISLIPQVRGTLFHSIRIQRGTAALALQARAVPFTTYRQLLFRKVWVSHAHVQTGVWQRAQAGVPAVEDGVGMVEEPLCTLTGTVSGSCEPEGAIGRGLRPCKSVSDTALNGLDFVEGSCCGFTGTAVPKLSLP